MGMKNSRYGLKNVIFWIFRNTASIVEPATVEATPFYPAFLNYETWVSRKSKGRLAEAFTKSEFIRR